MPTDVGRKRMQPHATRGSWRIAFWCAVGLMASSALLALSELFSDGSFGALTFWLYTAMFVVSGAQFLHLLRLRRNDEPFWDEEEAAELIGTAAAGDSRAGLLRGLMDHDGPSLGPLRTLTVTNVVTTTATPSPRASRFGTRNAKMAASP